MARKCMGVLLGVLICWVLAAGQTLADPQIKWSAGHPDWTKGGGTVTSAGEIVLDGWTVKDKEATLVVLPQDPKNGGEVKRYVSCTVDKLALLPSAQMLSGKYTVYLELTFEKTGQPDKKIITPRIDVEP